ncbi:MAG TPA: MarR family transcriptional regulator [Solirubrobacterales bacterium]|jgi:DNA-binding MarR family transcriptional regulator
MAKITAKQSLDESVRELLLLMPRLVGRAKRLPPPAQLDGFDLAPRHLSLLALLLLGGPQSVSELAGQLRLAPTTVSLLVAELAAKEVLSRSEDPEDRRRRIVDIDPGHREAIAAWLEPGARAWQRALEPLSVAERARFVATLHRYEEGVE